MDEKSVIKDDLIKFRWGGEPFFPMCFYGHLFLTDESLIIKYFFLAIPLTLKIPKLIGILPKIFVTPLLRITSIGTLSDTYNTIFIQFKDRQGSDREVYIKIWRPSFKFNFSLNNHSVDEWIEITTLAKRKRKTGYPLWECLTPPDGSQRSSVPGHRALP